MKRRPGSAAARSRGISLRIRLLVGLIGLTAVFLVVMGAVSTVALGRLERGELNSGLRLVAAQSPAQIAKGPDGFAAAYLSLTTGAVGQLTPPRQGR